MRETLGSTALVRVAHVIQSYPPVLGGAQRQVQRLGPLLARRGVEVTVITRRPPGTPAYEREPGIDVRRLSGPRSSAGASIAYTVRAAAVLARLRPDVIHVHDLLSPSTAALLGGLVARAPVVAKVLSTGPGGDVDRLLTKPFGARRLAAMSRSFAAFVCLSADVEDELVRHGVPRSRLSRIPNGVDTEVFRPPVSPGERAAARSAAGVRTEGALVLYCGRLAPVKRLEVLLEAVASVPGVALLLAGDGSEEDALRHRAAAPDLAGRVTFLPTVEDPAPLYRAADLYASASLTEGMSGSALEAMASGLPVLAAGASGMAELLAPDAGVLLGDPGPEALAVALGELAGDPEGRARLGAAARARVEESFSLAATADRLVELYRTVARP